MIKQIDLYLFAQQKQKKTSDTTISSDFVLFHFLASSNVNKEKDGELY